MKEVARDFRKESTRSEATLWKALRGRALEGRKFRRQQPIGPFVVDFYCAAERLVVEVDGGIHESQVEHDRDRQQLLETLGLRFVRLPAAVVENDLPAALTAIRKAFAPGTESTIRAEQVPPLPLWERGLGGEGQVAPSAGSSPSQETHA
ncbi:MAG: endonuclease domain-containing protein [Longimicrobiaceae bacterium]